MALADPTPTPAALCRPQVDNLPLLTPAGMACAEWFNERLGGTWAAAISTAIASGFVAADLGDAPIPEPALGPWDFPADFIGAEVTPVPISSPQTREKKANHSPEYKARQEVLC